MSDLTADDATLLRRIATAEVNGVPGACSGEVLDGLMGAGMVWVGFQPAEKLTEDCAWVRVSRAGWAWLAQAAAGEEQGG